MNIRNCEKCLSAYAPYKLDDAGSSVCCLSNPKAETKGLCPFCNPKSIYNRTRHFYEKVELIAGDRVVHKYPLFIENDEVYIMYYIEKVLLKDFLEK